MPRFCLPSERKRIDTRPPISPARTPSSSRESVVAPDLDRSGDRVPDGRPATEARERVDRRDGVAHPVVLLGRHHRDGHVARERDEAHAQRLGHVLHERLGRLPWPPRDAMGERPPTASTATCRRTSTTVARSVGTRSDTCGRATATPIAESASSSATSGTARRHAPSRAATRASTGRFGKLTAKRELRRRASATTPSVAGTTSSVTSNNGLPKLISLPKA